MPTSRVRRSSLLVFALIGAALTACARGRVEVAPAPSSGDGSASGEGGLARGGPAADVAEGEVIRAVTLRVADLMARGGACQAYGAVLDGSLAGRRIVVRPFMWRVGGRLASAQALSTGEIDVARHVDPLNIGLRSLDEVVHSVEHEAVHIAFAIPSGTEWNEVLVNERVEGCRSRGSAVDATP